MFVIILTLKKRSLCYVCVWHLKSVSRFFFANFQYFVRIWIKNALWNCIMTFIWGIDKKKIYFSEPQSIWIWSMVEFSLQKMTLSPWCLIPRSHYSLTFIEFLFQKSFKVVWHLQSHIVLNYLDVTIEESFSRKL